MKHQKPNKYANWIVKIVLIYLKIVLWEFSCQLANNFLAIQTISLSCWGEPCEKKSWNWKRISNFPCRTSINNVCKNWNKTEWKLCQRQKATNERLHIISFVYLFLSHVPDFTTASIIVAFSALSLSLLQIETFFPVSRLGNCYTRAFESRESSIVAKKLQCSKLEGGAARFNFKRNEFSPIRRH